MYAIATFVVVALLSMIFTRFATGALIATGLPPEIARFQARSAFTGAGFTTREAENVVNHPVRRKIISVTMLVGNLGTPTLILTVLLGFLVPGPGDSEQDLFAAVAGLVILLFFLRAGFITTWLVGIGHRYATTMLMPALEGDYEELFVIADDFVVAEVRLAAEPEKAPRSLRGLDHAIAEAKVLGIRRGGPEGDFVGRPPTDLELHRDDSLVLFGERAGLQRLTDTSG